MNNYRNYIIHTACTCLSNGKDIAQAGWGAVLVNPEGKTLQIAGPIPSKEKQSNYRAALFAVVQSIKQISNPATLKIYLNNKPIADSFWSYLDQWTRNGWRGNKGIVAHADLWKEVSRYKQRHELILHFLAKNHSSPIAQAAKDLATQGSKGETIILKS
jgi:ribonuclease HI